MRPDVVVLFARTVADGEWLRAAFPELGITTVVTPHMSRRIAGMVIDRLYIHPAAVTVHRFAGHHMVALIASLRKTRMNKTAQPTFLAGA